MSTEADEQYAQFIAAVKILAAERQSSPPTENGSPYYSGALFLVTLDERYGQKAVTDFLRHYAGDPGDIIRRWNPAIFDKKELEKTPEHPARNFSHMKFTHKERKIFLELFGKHNPTAVQYSRRAAMARIGVAVLGGAGGLSVASGVINHASQGNPNTTSALIQGGSMAIGAAGPVFGAYVHNQLKAFQAMEPIIKEFGAEVAKT